MKSYFNHVPWVLIGRYAELVKQFRQYGMLSPELCKAIDERRKAIHDQILESANIGRDDTDFAFWLASTVEEIIDEKLV